MYAPRTRYLQTQLLFINVGGGGATRSLARKTPFVTPGVPPLKFRPASLRLSQLPAHVATQGRRSRSSPVACRCCTPAPSPSWTPPSIYSFTYVSIFEGLLCAPDAPTKKKKEIELRAIKKWPFYSPDHERFLRTLWLAKQTCRPIGDCLLGNTDVKRVTWSGTDLQLTGPWERLQVAVVVEFEILIFFFFFF